MYNPITAIKDLYHKLVGREEIEQKPVAERGMKQLDLEKRLDELRRLQAYASTYRCHFANNPGFR